MNEQDPLRRNRLGLRGMLLVSGGVLVASSVFLLPNVGPNQGGAPTTSLPAPLQPTSAAGEAGASPTTPAVQSEGAAAGPADAVQPLLPVYWLGDVDGSDKLFREFRVAPAEGSGDPIADAVQLMTSGRPLDPDYRSPWRAASNVTSSISTKNVITLDISSDAFPDGLGEDEARLALQQLVYTATAAASDAGLITGGEASSVVVLVDGTAGYRAFDAVDLDGEWTRDSTNLAPVWIIDPQEDVEADTASLTILGVGPAVEQSLDWRIDRNIDGSKDGDAALFRDGSVDMAPQDGAPGAFSFSVTLPPGRYEITVSTPSDASSAADSKTVVVR